MFMEQRENRGLGVIRNLAVYTQWLDWHISPYKSGPTLNRILTSIRTRKSDIIYSLLPAKDFIQHQTKTILWPEIWYQYIETPQISIWGGATGMVLKMTYIINIHTLKCRLCVHYFPSWLLNLFTPDDSWLLLVRTLYGSFSDLRSLLTIDKYQHFRG